MLEQLWEEIHRLAARQPAAKQRPVLRRPHGAGEHPRTGDGRRHQRRSERKGRFSCHPGEKHRTVLGTKNDNALTEIDSRLEELQLQLVKLASSKADYEDVAEEIYHLHEQKQKVQMENANRDELHKWMADMRAFLREQSTEVAEYDEKLFRRLIEKVTVYEDRFAVEFKSGVMVDVEKFQ